MSLKNDSGIRDSTLKYELQRHETCDLEAGALENVRRRTYDVVLNAMQSDGATLVDAMPAAGKSHNTFDVARDTGLPISYLAEREDLYKEAARRSHKRDLDCKTLPSPHRKCPTFMGEHGEELKRKVRQLYQRGLSGRDLHAQIDLPCNPNCRYTRAWDFEPTEHDVLIGHYSHAHVPRVVEDRVVVVDEFPGDSAISKFTHEHDKPSPEPLVSHYLEQRAGLPFEDWSDLLAGREDDERRQEGLQWFLNNDEDPSTEEVVEDDSGHAHTTAGKLVGGLLLAENLGNGFESTAEATVGDIDGYPWKVSKRDILGNRTLVHDRRVNGLYLLNPPELAEAESVVGLDGTPCFRMWDTALGEDFSVEQVVPDDERDHYVHDVLNIDVCEAEISDEGGPKPYHNDEYVTTTSDANKLFGLGIEYDEEPALITTKTALREYDEKGVMKYAGLSTNYGQIHSSNEFEDETVGIISGSPHPGDDPVKRWCAFFGIEAETEDRGEDTDFGSVGNAVFQNYVHDEVLQAVLRFSRDASGATVLVNTTATPDWLTTENIDLPATSPSERRIIDTLRVADDPLSQEMICTLAGVSRNRVSEIVDEFKEDGLVEFGTDEKRTLCYEWSGFN